jgi:hypothetical protein
MRQLAAIAQRVDVRTQRGIYPSHAIRLAGKAGRQIVQGFVFIK